MSGNKPSAEMDDAKISVSITEDKPSEEMDNSKISREEIIKKFDLPERKTKLKTILKMQEKPEEPLYCICRSADISTFMIGCDRCDEWFHGACIGLDEIDAQMIRKWYCFLCEEKHGMIAEYHVKPSSHKKRKREKEYKRQDRYENLRKGLGCGTCCNCLLNEECGNINFLKPPEKQPKKAKHSNASCSTATSAVADLRKGLSCGKCSNCLRNEECGNINLLKPLEKQPKQAKHSSASSTTVINTVTEYQAITYEDKRKGKEIKKREKDSARALAVSKSKTCSGPCCTRMARNGSKYCSVDCGLALAKVRIEALLPRQVAYQLDNPSVAEQLDRAKLEEIVIQKNSTFSDFQRANLKEKELLELIGKAKKLPILQFGEEIVDDSKMYCITCGWEVPSQIWTQHIHNCFRKYEAKIPWMSYTKCNTGDCQIYCDFYDAAKKTYCMRLRYVCPEHHKPRKPADDEVCGCPVVEPFLVGSFSSKTERFCQKQKKSCIMHWNWECLAMSDIDLERQRLWAKLNKLIKQEAEIYTQISNRCGALALLLHTTKKH